ncbi:MAG: hypothetical protein R3B35_02835 [Gemmatimonadales bacterium]
MARDLPAHDPDDLKSDDLDEAELGPSARPAETGRHNRPAPGWSPPEEPLGNLFHRLVTAVRDRGYLGRDETVGIAALALARYLATGQRLNLLIVGPPGSGKSALANGLATATSLPVATLPANTLIGSGWSGGMTVPDFVMAQGSLFTSPRAVVIESLEAAGVLSPGLHGNALDRVNHISADLASLLDGAFTRRSPWPWLVIATAHLAKLRPAEDGAVGAQVLLDAGLHPALASRFDEVLVLQPMPPAEIVSVIDGLVRSRTAALSIGTGYDLRWTAPALRAVHAAALGDPHGGLRSGIAVLDAALRRALLNGVSMGVPIGGPIIVSPDHVVPHGTARPDTWPEIERDLYG